nr:response regulator [Brasilonema sp. UFV-L1]
MCDWGKSHRPEYNFGYLRLKGLQILVVAAEADVRNRLRTVLEKRNAQVITVASPHAALEVLLQQPPQALVVDMGASSEDSYALMRQVRNLSVEQGGQIPAIALTDHNLDRSQLIRKGFEVHLVEPFDPVELVATLASLTSYSQ